MALLLKKKMSYERHFYSKVGMTFISTRLVDIVLTVQSNIEDINLESVQTVYWVSSLINRIH